MNYIRIDESQINPLNVFYFLYPYYGDEKEPAYNDLIFSQPFKSYTEASEFAMLALKMPEMFAIKWNSEHIESLRIDTEYLKKLKELSEIEVYQELLVYNDKWELIDCPEEYSKYVGCVMKDTSEEEKPDPEKLYS